MLSVVLTCRCISVSNIQNSILLQKLAQETVDWNFYFLSLQISECAKWGGTNMGATIIYFAMQSQKQKANSRWAGRKLYPITTADAALNEKCGESAREREY